MTTLIRTFGGNIGIGTTDPGSYKLRVEGGVKATSMEVAGVLNALAPSGLIGIWYGNVAANLPTGWVLCDGQNGTPDLRERVVRGAAGDAAPSPTVLNTTGGSDNITMSNNTMKQHNHQVSISQANAPHSHYVQGNNMGHSHGSRNAGGHNHNLYGITWRSLNNYDNYNVHGGGYAIEAKNNMNQWTQASGSHSHYVDGSNAPHTHSSRNTDSPHPHGGTCNNTGSGNSISIVNPYHALYYIMKT
tara:strand:- start:235 stop:969 length:735 start_codon:yes stop_codon:yes gene_type:complete